jgi:uncharacterized membrane protein HdeD (DUF308 family)
MVTETSNPRAAGLFARNWWVFLLRGLVALFLGVMIFRQPGLALSVFVLGFAIYAIFEGASALFAAVRGWNYRTDRWLLLLEALAGISVGIITLRRPGMTAFVLIFFIAAWALATGILKIVEAVNLDGVSGRGWLAVGGVASIIFAWLILFRPLNRALVMASVIGIYAVILGLTEIVLAFSLRGRRPLELSGRGQPAHPRAA